METEMQFKEIVAQYCQIKPEDMHNDMRFREDLGLSSLDFMSLLGDLEDAFDVDLENEDLRQVLTIEQALELMKRLQRED